VIPFNITIKEARAIPRASLFTILAAGMHLAFLNKIEKAFTMIYKVLGV
jgi:hypothetical protein